MGRILLLAVIAAFVLTISADQPTKACTIGVASGVVTIDGRPVLWKSRQWAIEDNMVVRRTSLDTGYPYDFIGVRGPHPPNTEIRMGVNVHGLVVGNALNGGSQNSWFMEYALGNFQTVAQVESYLKTALSQQPPTLNAHSCFEFIDATGAAFMFETVPTNPDPKDRLFVYDTLDQDRLDQDMWGWVVRRSIQDGESGAHENHSGMDNPPGGPGTGGRYETAVYNTFGLLGSPLQLSPFAVTQGYGGWTGYEFLRYGPVPDDYDTIATPDACSAMAVHGVLPGEDAALTTMWVALGQTNFAFSVPLWIASNHIPARVNTADMASVAYALHNYSSALSWELAVQTCVFPAERHMFEEVDEIMLHWRQDVPHAIVWMPRVEEAMTGDAYSLLESLLACAPGTNMAPTVKIKITKLESPSTGTAGGPPYVYRFEAIADDPDGTIVRYRWDFGDFADCPEAPKVVHRFLHPGWYLVSCQVMDDHNTTTTEWVYLHIAGDAEG